MFGLSDRFRSFFPEAKSGFLVLTDISPSQNSSEIMLEIQKGLEGSLRQRYRDYTRKDLKDLHEIRSYTNHYKKFNKTYHVLLQLESVALKGKELFRGNILVQIMLMAELKNLLLTSIHDLEKTRGTILVDRSEGTETYEGIDGTVQTLKQNDMFMKDRKGIISSVIYGPDSRTRVDDETTSALFTVYAPAGIGEDKVRSHLLDIRDYVLTVSPDSTVSNMEIL